MTNRDVERAHNVLKHLDSIKPILQLDFNYVKLVNERLTRSKPDHILLNYYDVLVADVMKIFPNQAAILTGLISIFQFHKPHVGLSVMVLDILTTLSILTTGSVTEKSKLLFQLYNINQMGLMEEAEHVNFMLRTSHCMKKLRLMGVLDLSAPDAKYIALDARVKYENNQITYAPGLYLADFTRWVQTSKECQTLFKFVKVLNRLVDSLLTLETRTNAVLSIMEAKKSYMANAPYVPPPEMFKSCMQTNASAFVVFRSQTCVSMSIPLLNLQTDEVYIKYDKVVPSPPTLYEISRAILKRNADICKANREPDLQCCGKNYLLTGYRRQLVHTSQRTASQIPFLRVDLPELEPATSYFVTIYTVNVKFRTVRVTTLNNPLLITAKKAKRKPSRGGSTRQGSVESKGSGSECDEEGEGAEDSVGFDDNSGHEDDGSSSDRGFQRGSSRRLQRHHHSGQDLAEEQVLPGMCILPSSLSVRAAEAFWKSTSQNKSSSCIVFTGTICPVEQAVRDCVPLTEVVENTAEFATRLGGTVGTMIASQLALQWQRSLGVLMGITQCEGASKNIHELVAAVERQQMLCYNGAGPWGCVDVLRVLRSLFGESVFSAVQKRVEEEYGKYLESVVPPVPTIREGCNQLYFLRNALPGPTDSSLTLDDLTEMLFKRLRSGDLGESTAEHVIIVVRDPSDLLNVAVDAGSALKTVKSNTAAAGGKSLKLSARSGLLQKPADTTAPAPKEKVKLTGRHEILHGEYSSKHRPDAEAPLDVDILGLMQEEDSGDVTEHSAEYSQSLNTFLRVAARWLRGGLRSTDYDLDWQVAANKRRITIVSCNWDNGENFEIDLDPSSHASVKICHENLLPTKSYEPPQQCDSRSASPVSFAPPISGATSKPLTAATSTASMRSLLSATSKVSKVSETKSAGKSEAQSGTERASSHTATVVAPPKPPLPSVSELYKISLTNVASIQASESLLARLQTSLPKLATLTIGNPTPLRAIQMPGQPDDDMETEEFTPCTVSAPIEDTDCEEPLWWYAALAARDDAALLRKVDVTAGPHVVRCAVTSAAVSVSVVGLGRVYCTLYEVPVHVQYQDVVSVICTADRAKLRCIEMKSQFCSGERHLVYHFDRLTPYCCYCAVIDPYVGTPPVAFFRTLGLPSSNVDGILVCPATAEDFRNPSLRLHRAAHFAAICRSPASVVFCLDYDAAVMRNTVGEELPLKSDLNFLGKATNLRQPGSDREGNFHSALPFIVNSNPVDAAEMDSVHFSTHGQFCYISTHNESSSSLRKVIQAVRALRVNPEVKLLVLLVNQPLIRYMRQRIDGQLVCDGPMNQHKLLCCLLMMCLLDWKALDENNDCKIICTAPVSAPKCVVIRYAHHISDAINPRERHDELSVATHREPFASGAAGSPDLRQGGSLLEMPSILEDSGVIGEASFLNSLAYQSVLEERRAALKENSLDSRGVDFANLDSIFDSIDDYSVNDLQIQSRLAAALHPSTSLEDTLNVDRSVHVPNIAHDRAAYVTIEHLILPIDYHTVEGEEVDESITLPEGKCLMEDIVEYEALHEFSAEETGIYPIGPKLDLYKDSIAPEDKIQPIVYRLEFFIRKLKTHPAKETAVVPVPEAVPTVGLMESSVLSAVVSADTQHRCYFRPLLNEVDLVELLLGPVVGKVTSDSVLVLFEFNMNLRQLSCVLQPLGAMDENEFVYKTIENIKGFELLEVQYSELIPGTYYEIFLPELTGTKAIGKFKTVQPFLSFAQIAVTGSNTLLRHPILNVLVDQLQHQQSPNLMEIRLLNEMIAEDERMARNSAATYRMESMGGFDNTFAKLGDHLNTPGVHTAVVFHIGAISVLAQYWSSLIHALIDHARRLEIPLRDASTVGHWYFKQIEQVVKDTFRLFWSTPVVKEVLSHTSNVPIYHSQYLLPLSVLDDKIEAARIANSEEDNMLLQLVRRIFETHLQAYLSRLYGWESGASNHYISWQSNSMVTICLDIASGRRKVKKKGEVDPDDADEAPTATAAAATTSTKKGKADSKAEGGKVDAKDPFSLGFIDRTQWKSIRVLVLDRTLTHIVIFTERPILSLTHIPREFRNPESVSKGEILDWKPTNHDLEAFFKFWFDWLAMFQSGEISSCRSLLLVSSSKIPYSTLIQEIKTGLKIQQLCVGEYDNGTTASSLPFKPKGGKIGGMRYIHQLDEQDFMHTQSTGIERNSTFIERGPESSPTQLVPTASSEKGNSQSALVLTKSSGFATLRLWFDSWKALGIWSQEPPDSSTGGVQLRDATLLLGPMLGAPVLHRVAKPDGIVDAFFTVSMLIEVDRPTTVVLVASSLLSKHELTVEMKNLAPRRPYVVDIGPLEPEGRYNVRLQSGLKPSPYNTFVIDTYIHENETNIMAINCTPVTGEASGSQLIIEASKRCAVPFCGMTAVLHMNFQPNFDRVINEFRYSNLLIEELKEARRLGQLTAAFRIHLENVIEVFRDQYRTVLSKPSYAELLRNGFNLMMRNYFAGFTDDMEPDESSDLYQISRLVMLIIARLNQEYFDKWMTPHVNVFRAVAAVDPEKDKARQAFVDIAEPGAQATEPPIPSPIMEWSDAEAPAVDCVFQQWLNNCKAAPYKWTNWVSPNGKVSIEQILSVNEDNYAAIVQQLSASPIEHGTRIIVINQDPSHDDAADALFLGESDIGVRFQEVLAKWKCKQEDREVCIICPSPKYGTRKIDVKLTTIEPPPPPPEPAPVTEGEEVVLPPAPEVFEIVFKDVYMIDTVHRSNEFQRLQKQSEKDKDLLEKNKAGKKKVAAAAAKSKRAQRQREEEEKQRKEEVAREVAELRAAQVPDGYIIIGCTTTSVQTAEFTAMLTNPPRVKVIGDFIGTEEEKQEMFDDLVDGIPTAFDFIQLPEWFRKFSPSMETMFVRDEVLLLMRQNPETKKILNIIEDGEYLPQLITMYEKSRLSELSRPEDLREVDMKIDGVVPMFFRDLVRKMWDKAVPAEIKPHMFSLQDDFIMSYCFARALPDPAALSSGLEFAKAVQYALLLSLSLRSAQIMSKLDRYAYIIKNPDFPTQKVKAMELKEKAVVEEKFANENRKVAADKAWRLADPVAAAERDRLAAEAEAEAAAMSIAIAEIAKKDANAAAQKHAEDMARMMKEVEQALSVVDINYDSDIDAINNDEAELLKLQAAAQRVEQMKQKDIDHTMHSVKAFTSERAERVALTKSQKKKAEGKTDGEEEGADVENEDFDLERDGIERLEELRSEWLVAAVEVAMEVVVEKEIYSTVALAAQQLMDECYTEAMGNFLPTTEHGKLAHAKLQVQRLRSETAKSRRVYGKRMSFMY